MLRCLVTLEMFGKHCDTLSVTSTAMSYPASVFQARYETNTIAFGLFILLHNVVCQIQSADSVIKQSIMPPKFVPFRGKICCYIYL